MNILIYIEVILGENIFGGVKMLEGISGYMLAGTLIGIILGVYLWKVARKFGEKNEVELDFQYIRGFGLFFYVICIAALTLDIVYIFKLNFENNLNFPNMVIIIIFAFIALAFFLSGRIYLKITEGNLK
jgi:hypothetical protein